MTEHLVVVDMQNVFAEPSSDWFAPRFVEILEPIDRLVASYAPRVTFTRFIAPDEPKGAWRDYYAEWPFALQAPDAHLYGLVDRYADHGPASMPATTFGKWGPQLADRLGDADRIAVAGVSTDCCVLSTTLAAADAGVGVRVVTDACAGADDTTHEQALAVMRLYAPLVRLVTSTEALAERSAILFREDRQR